MRISDWSSDVCSSDLAARRPHRRGISTLAEADPLHAAADVKAHSVKGQYTSGAVNGGAVSGYADELGNPSNTETFVALKAFIDNWPWKGVPFYLRTGKRMPQRDRKSTPLNSSH